MTTLHELLRRVTGDHCVHRDEAGQGLAEYALIITFVALVVVGSLTVMGTTISGPINTVAGKF